jgi:hypothetical protein
VYPEPEAKIIFSINRLFFSNIQWSVFNAVYVKVCPLKKKENVKVCLSVLLDTNGVFA